MEWGCISQVEGLPNERLLATGVILLINFEIMNHQPFNLLSEWHGGRNNGGEKDCLDLDLRRKPICSDRFIHKRKEKEQNEVIHAEVTKTKKSS